MKILRTLGYVFGICFIALAIGTLIAMWAYRDIPANKVEAKYVGPASRFMHVDGVRIHYRDEGEGPAVLLLHANFGSLIDWDPWIEALGNSYRVVRLDFTSHGLTGPDPTGDYSQERTLELTEKFVDAVGLDRFSIAGTSMGGTMAVRYAYEHPERIENLILLNPDSLENRRHMQGDGDEIPDAAYLLTYILPRALPEFMLKQGFGDEGRLTYALVDRWHDLWLREGQREAQLDRLRQFEMGNSEEIIRSLTPPTLLMWGEADTTANFEHAREFREMLENVESLKFISYPGVGHMAVQEAGPETGHDVRTYLDERRKASTGGDPGN